MKKVLKNDYFLERCVSLEIPKNGVYFPIPADNSENLIENKTLEQYLNVARELKNFWAIEGDNYSNNCRSTRNDSEKPGELKIRESRRWRYLKPFQCR